MRFSVFSQTVNKRNRADKKTANYEGHLQSMPAVCKLEGSQPFVRVAKFLQETFSLSFSKVSLVCDILVFINGNPQITISLRINTQLSSELFDIKVITISILPFYIRLCWYFQELHFSQSISYREHLKHDNVTNFVQTKISNYCFCSTLSYLQVK